jgi:hypothetical protein
MVITKFAIGAACLPASLFVLLEAGAGAAQAAAKAQNISVLGQVQDVPVACQETKKGRMVPGVMRGRRFVRLQSLMQQRKQGKLRAKNRRGVGKQLVKLTSKCGAGVRRSLKAGCSALQQGAAVESVALNSAAICGRPAAVQPNNGGDAAGIPQLAQWKANMNKFGRENCSALRNGGDFDSRLLGTYYDAQWVYLQIAEYTGDNSWMSCADAAEAVYRDEYVRPNDGRIPGFWNFTHGLTQDYLRTNDGVSRQSALTLAQNAAFARDNTPEDTSNVDYSREVAYAIHAYLNAELLGAPRRARLSQLVDQAVGHINHWVVTQDVPYVRPFMVALTAHALIAYHEQVGDRNMVPVIQKAMDWLWDHLWLPDAGAFMYTDRQTDTGGTEAAPDLNLLIAPAYAWLYHQTGSEAARQRADAIFAGGVKGAFLNNGKQFDQSYRWSFDFVRWRTQAPLQ